VLVPLGSAGDPAGQERGWEPVAWLLREAATHILIFCLSSDDQLGIFVLAERIDLGGLC
jgi:hypothetical protein